MNFTNCVHPCQWLTRNIATDYLRLGKIHWCVFLIKETQKSNRDRKMYNINSRMYNIIQFNPTTNLYSVRIFYGRSLRRLVLRLWCIVYTKSHKTKYPSDELIDKRVSKIWILGSSCQLERKIVRIYNVIIYPPMSRDHRTRWSSS